jgi:hypothetical protein
MSCRIGDGARSVSFTTTVSIAIGYQDCHFCGAETPTPSDDVLVKVARDIAAEGAQATTLWPQGGWMPPGWQVHDSHLTCPGCVAAINAALAERRKNA